MKLKNLIIFNAIEPINKLSSVELPIKTAYKIKKNLDILTPQFKIINESRNDLIKRYGNEDKIDPSDKEAVKSFVHDFNEVLEIEEELDIKTITLDELEGAKLNASDLSFLMFMIEEVE